MRALNQKAENMTREFAVNGNHLIATKRRSAFTLIELLVVMAIIAILAALILAGVMVFFRKGPEVKNRHDILQLSEALQNFKKRYGQYPPSRIRLRANISEYQTKRVDALDDESVAFLSLMWPQIAGLTTIQWAGGTAMPPAGFVLEGDQCLVFFLGGPPVGGGKPGLMGGFSTNPLNPIDPTNTNRKKDFDFEAARLFNRVGGNPFFSYYDVYGKQPFIYFSSNKRPNGYVPLWIISQRYDAGDTVTFNGSFYRCTATNIGKQPPMAPWVVTPTHSLGVNPYFSQAAPTMQFYMPDSFQLISAGADGKFGPGGQWTEANAGVIAADGKDDVVQFRDRVMGIP